MSGFLRAGSEIAAKDQRALIFLHIHKTAGTTLHRILERQYNPFRIFTIEGRLIERSVAHFKKLPERRRARLQVVKGHLSFGIHEFLPQPSTYITFLRDPVERAISSYFYARGNPINAFHKRIHREKLDLPAFLELTRWNDNLQCKVLAGIEREEFCPRAIFQAASRIGAPAPDPAFDRWSNAETLETAKQNLARHFSFVGLTEKFAEGLVVLRHLFGWNLSSYASFRKSNRPDRERLPQSALDAARAHNALDIQLYEFGKTLFRKSLEDAGFDVAQEAVRLLESPVAGGFRALPDWSAMIFRAAASRAVSWF